jgi:hypothetical protein
VLECDREGFASWDRGIGPTGHLTVLVWEGTILHQVFESLLPNDVSIGPI